ncbi:VCBS repeat-containing protein [Phragmitibacter flavus]|uniref:VCBS repeat-containing protein n=1 Tax=Phragmitibacter flavus TaxID=2576071 RepID=A0A5R8KFX6_9BACT|nr:VCBS repeat-containing protein [Phragmitibacter flavus]TLD71200.1 VCBS repeat-containing protein [Phragmitibacter flavus]
MRFHLCLIALLTTSVNAQTPQFRPQTIDSAIQIGYGLAIADVQGDGKPDILLADKTQIVWYENPTWQKHVIAENLTEKDNVCIAARDIDGDGKCEIAVGAGWNPSDTETSGAVFYLIPPADRTQKWEPVALPHEPTTHRMKWVKRGKDRFDLVVVPLHGRGNKNGEGAGVKILAYQKPANPRHPWPTEVISDDMHLTHNFDVTWGDEHQEKILLSGKEGWESRFLLSPVSPVRIISQFTHQNQPELKGIGEIRQFRRQLLVATIEPMHGNQLVLYSVSGITRGGPYGATRSVLDDTLADGHALATADLLNLGHDQIIVGWRAMSNRLAKVGIKMFIAKDTDGREWETHLIDDNTMACEDLIIADLNGDNKPDIIASGRRTQNVIIYWNESVTSASATKN